MRSNSQIPVEYNYIIAATLSILSSDYIRIYHIPSADQTILKKIGLPLSNHTKTGEVVRIVLYWLNNNRNVGV